MSQIMERILALRDSDLEFIESIFLNQRSVLLGRDPWLKSNVAGAL